MIKSDHEFIEKKFLSFPELGNLEDLAPREVIATFNGYAEDGWDINGEYVVSLIERSKPNESEIQNLMALAVDGIIAITKNRTASQAEAIKHERDQYALVLGNLGVMLENINGPIEEYLLVDPEDYDDIEEEGAE